MISELPCDQPNERRSPYYEERHSVWDTLEAFHDTVHKQPWSNFQRMFKPLGTDDEMLEKLQCMIPTANNPRVPKEIRLRMGHLAWHLQKRKKVAVDKCKKVISDLGLVEKDVNQKAMRALESEDQEIWGFA